MVTGASTADLAVILIDARKGVLTQTRRHSYLCHLIGIRNIVLAVNKMDLVDYEPGGIRPIVADYADSPQRSASTAFTPCRSPASRATTSPRTSANTPWYSPARR
jgi:bifunctional enzyme CysN/CysC